MKSVLFQSLDLVSLGNRSHDSNIVERERNKKLTFLHSGKDGQMGKKATDKKPRVLAASGSRRGEPRERDREPLPGRRSSLSPPRVRGSGLAAAKKKPLGAAGPNRGDPKRRQILKKKGLLSFKIIFLIFAFWLFLMVKSFLFIMC